MDEYTDTRFMSKDFLRGFIELYRKNIALWKITAKDYNNKRLKEKGYDELVEYCQEFFPQADKEFVRKRAQNMRGCFRKEYKKVMEYQRRGEIYEPRLWYYELFLFTKDTKSDDMEPQSVENDDIFIKSENNLSDEELAEECSENAESRDSVINTCTMNQPQNMIQTTDTGKRKLPEELPEEPESKRTHFIIPTRNGGFVDEFEAIGVNVAAKLRRMNSTQQILAEALITKVIVKGLFGELTRKCDIFERAEQVNGLEKD